MGAPFWCMCLWRILFAVRDHCDSLGGLQECHSLWPFTCMTSSARDGFERMTRDGSTEILIGRRRCIVSFYFCVTNVIEYDNKNLSLSYFFCKFFLLFNPFFLPLAHLSQFSFCI